VASGVIKINVIAKERKRMKQSQPLKSEIAARLGVARNDEAQKNRHCERM